MPDKKRIFGDYKMVERQLKEKSNILNISVDELIDRYIRRKIFFDYFYTPPKRTKEELVEMAKKAVEEDKKRGIFPKKHNFDFFVGLNNKYD